MIVGYSIKNYQQLNKKSDDEVALLVYTISPQAALHLQKKRRKSEWGMKLPLLNIPTRAEPDPATDFQPHSLWLTRGQTELSEAGLVGGAKKTKEQQMRGAYLQLDELKPGDVFVSVHCGLFSWRTLCIMYISITACYCDMVNT